MKFNTDIDIDVKNREEILSVLKHVPALNVENNNKHNVGVYFQNIPFNPYLGTACYNYKEAEDLGYFKIDILNNSVYENIRDEAHLMRLINTEPMWELLEHKEIVEKLVHIHSYHNILKEMKPTSIEQLAMVLALIRPAKKYLIGKSWNEIEKEVWIKPTNDSYYFKKSHATAFSLSIIVQLNQLVETV